MDKNAFKVLLSTAVRDLLSPFACHDSHFSSEREDRISELLTAIKTFLDDSQMMDIRNITTQYPELGQVLSILSQDLQILATPAFYTDLIRSIMWFYRPTSQQPLEIKTTRWATDLMSNSIRYPMKEMQVVVPELERLGGHLSIEKLFKTVLAVWHQRVLSSNSLHYDFESISKNLLLLITTGNVDMDLLVDAMIILPPADVNWCPNESVIFYEKLSRMINRGERSYPLELHKQLSGKYAIHLENELVRLFLLWAGGCSDFGTHLGDSWLIGTIIQDKHLFCIAIQYATGICVQMDFHYKALEFMHQLLNESRKHGPLLSLYPPHLSTLVSLLDIDPIDLGTMQDTFAVTIVRKITSEISSGKMSRMEASMLCSLYPNWWIPIKMLSQHPDIKVQLDLQFLWNILGRESLNEVFEKVTNT